jgi:CheY-like chemotaxis protein
VVTNRKVFKLNIFKQIMESKGKILIADDKEPQRELVSEFIGILFPEYKLEVFEEGESLKNRLEGLVGKETNVKLVLTDNQMPGYEGSKLIEKY